MLYAWIVFIISTIIFSLIGAVGIFHTKKYKIEGDITPLVTSFYIFFMISIIVFTMLLVFLNGVNAPINLPIINNIAEGFK